jgi:hypothetical protein
MTGPVTTSGANRDLERCQQPEDDEPLGGRGRARSTQSGGPAGMAMKAPDRGLTNSPSIREQPAAGLP